MLSPFDTVTVQILITAIMVVYAGILWVVA
jgi:hypothetical protein